MRTASWVVKELGTGKVIMETYDRKKVDAINTTRYQAVPIQEHLAGLNRKLQLEAVLLACFNEQQELEGFKAVDGSEEAYVAKDATDAIFKMWLSDCRIEDAVEYRELIELT